MIGVNVDINVGRAACEASSATWNLGTNSVFSPGLRKTNENLDRFGRAQEKSTY
jgi:hypothetical protein